jgi:hypothetical protein
MRNFMIVPGALLDPLDWEEAAPGLGAQEFGFRLNHLLRGAPVRARTFEQPWTDGAAHLAWLAEAFRVDDQPPVMAPYAWEHLVGEEPRERRDGQLWFCDPVHLSLQPQRTTLSPIDRPRLRASEIEELRTLACDSVRPIGGELHIHDDRWFLWIPTRWELSAVPLQAVLGASVQTRLPSGADARAWRRLLNEIQMRWHSSETNRQRDRHGEVVVNALWLHGGGRWQPLPPAAFARVETVDPVVQGWHKACATATARIEDTLSVWTGLFEPYWRKDWVAWATAWNDLLDDIRARMRSGEDRRRSTVELVACGRRSALSFSIGRRRLAALFVKRRLRDCLVEPVS